MFAERTRRKTKSINMTALIDVIFQLIVYLMVTTTFIEIDAIDMTLPDTAEEGDAKTSKITSEQHITLIDIGDTTQLYLNRTFIKEADLAPALKKIIQADSTKQILVRAAENVSVQRLVDIMDVVHHAGGRTIAVDDWDGILPASEVAPIPEPALFNPFQRRDGR